MLASAARDWPVGDGWVVQPKWDGFRMLVSVDARGVRAWSRRGVRLDGHLEPLLAPFADAPDGTVFDGELVALRLVDGMPVQDFVSVGRAALHGDSGAVRQLHYVAFDLLCHGGRDIRQLRWSERDALLAQALPAEPRIRAIQSWPASTDVHDRLVALGFEGSLLKRAQSGYRPGRQTGWRKFKCRHRVPAVLRELRTGRDGFIYAICESDGRRIVAAASSDLENHLGEEVRVI